MLIGILQFELHIHGAESLKDKRRVLLSVKDRLHREHLVSVAEVAMQDSFRVGVLGLALVGSDGKHLGAVLDSILAKLRGLHDAELGEVAREILHGSQLFTSVSDEGDPLDEESLAAEMLRRASDPPHGTPDGLTDGPTP